MRIIDSELIKCAGDLKIELGRFLVLVVSLNAAEKILSSSRPTLLSQFLLACFSGCNLIVTRRAFFLVITVLLRVNHSLGIPGWIAHWVSPGESLIRHPRVFFWGVFWNPAAKRNSGENESRLTSGISRLTSGISLDVINIVSFRWRWRRKHGLLVFFIQSQSAFAVL